MDYFTQLQREQGQVKANPENYLPWNYLKIAKQPNPN
jgi:hypothetical protein